MVHIRSRADGEHVRLGAHSLVEALLEARNLLAQA